MKKRVKGRNARKGLRQEGVAKQAVAFLSDVRPEDDSGEETFETSARLEPTDLVLSGGVNLNNRISEPTE